MCRALRPLCGGGGGCILIGGGGGECSLRGFAPRSEFERIKEAMSIEQEADQLLAVLSGLIRSQ